MLIGVVCGQLSNGSYYLPRDALLTSHSRIF